MVNSEAIELNGIPHWQFDSMTVLQIIHQVSYDEIRYTVPVACSVRGYILASQ